MTREEALKVLGIGLDTNTAAIKKARDNKAREYHPDKYKADDATEKMQQVNEAYAILKDSSDDDLKLFGLDTTASIAAIKKAVIGRKHPDGVHRLEPLGIDGHQPTVFPGIDDRRRMARREEGELTVR